MTSLVEKVPGLESCLVTSNCVDRADGADIVVRMDFADRAAMQDYLDSDLHAAAKGENKSGLVETITFFDSEAPI